LRISRGKVDLINDGNESEALGEGKVEVGYRLGLNSLRSIYEKKRWSL